MLIINIISYKGGTGKTTISRIIAEKLSNTHSSKVYLLDLDPYPTKFSSPSPIGKLAPSKINENFYILSSYTMMKEGTSLAWRELKRSALYQSFFDTICEYDKDNNIILVLDNGASKTYIDGVNKVKINREHNIINILVTTSQNIATYNNLFFLKHTKHPTFVIQNLSTMQCSHCNHKEYVFSKNGVENMVEQVKENKKVEYVGQIDIIPEIQEFGDTFEFKDINKINLEPIEKILKRVKDFF